MPENHSDKIRWGIIGVGDVCEVKSGPAFGKAEGSELVAVMRRNGEKAKDYASRHGVAKWYDDADALLEDPEVDCIYIATPPDTHAHYTIKSAEANKAVYVEKPMARTHAECLTMIAACEKAGVPLFAAYYRRCLPNFLKVKALVEDAAIGDILYVDIQVRKSRAKSIIPPNPAEDNWRVIPEISGGGYFYDLASHQLDFLDYLFGPIVDAKGIARNQMEDYAAEDTTLGVFQFDNGILGSGAWCFSTAENAEEEKTTIVGTKGSISFPFFGDNSVTLSINGERDDVFAFEMPQHIQQPLVQSAVDHLLGKRICPSTGISAARTNAVMEKLTNRTP